jgi:Winged helix DNA-binding domain
VRSLTWQQVVARRLARSHLPGRSSARDLVEAVRDTCGVHAQRMSAAELSIAARVTGVSQSDVRSELWERRRLVKTWTLRGTLHIHPADELGLWTAARRAVEGSWHEDYGIEPARAQSVIEAIGDALDRRRLTRQQLAAEVAGRVGGKIEEKLASGWAHYLDHAAAAGLLCHGPPQGSRVTFVRPTDWLDEYEEVEPQDALAEVARRYLSAYGPATHREFAQWFGGRDLRPARARRLFETISDDLAEVDVAGKRAWLLSADDGEPAANADHWVRLLPEYDCFLMGFREREHLLPDAARSRLRSHGRGRYEGPGAIAWLAADGEIAGLWHRGRRGKRVEIRVEPFTRLTADQRELLDGEVSRIGEFLALEPTLSIGRH